MNLLTIPIRFMFLLSLPVISTCACCIMSTNGADLTYTTSQPLKTIMDWNSIGTTAAEHNLLHGRFFLIIQPRSKESQMVIASFLWDIDRTFRFKRAYSSKQESYVLGVDNSSCCHIKLTLRPAATAKLLWIYFFSPPASHERTVFACFPSAKIWIMELPIAIF